MDMIINPRKEKGEKDIPEFGIFFINPAEYTRFKHSYDKRSWEQRTLFNSNLYVHCDKEMFVAGPAIGAPMATMSLEKLIVLGAKKILVFGWCGGLLESDSIGDIVIGKSAVSGEGTSRYYSDDKEFLCSTDLTSFLGEQLQKNSLEYRDGLLWSTDAPYRESRDMFTELVDNHCIDSVDMELSALCSVAALRSIELAGLFIISDLPLEEKWSAGYRTKSFKKRSNSIVELLMEIKASEGE